MGQQVSKLHQEVAVLPERWEDDRLQVTGVSPVRCSVDPLGVTSWIPGLMVQPGTNLGAPPPPLPPSHLPSPR